MVLSLPDQEIVHIYGSRMFVTDTTKYRNLTPSRMC